MIVLKSIIYVTIRRGDSGLMEKTKMIQARHPCLRLKMWFLNYPPSVGVMELGE